MKDFFFYPVALRPEVGQAFLIPKVTRSHTTIAPHSVALFWTSSRIVAENSIWQHTTLKTVMPPAWFEPTISAGGRPQNYPLDRKAAGTGYEGTY